MDKEYPLNTPNKYLEDKIFEALEQRGLVDDSKTPLIFQPQYSAEGYKTIRRWILDNIKTLSLTGGGIAIGTAFVFPRIAAVIGSASILGILAPIDRYLYHNPKDVAQRIFRHIERPWREAYDKLEIKNARALDDLVYMAQTPDSVNEEFPHYNQQVSLGITIARIADFLHEISMSHLSKGPRAGISERTRELLDEIGTSSLSRKYGITTERVIEMLARQKVGTPEETEMIKKLTEEFSISHLAETIDRGVIFPGNDFYVLQKHATNYELVLKIANANGQSIGSQLSRGHLIVSEDVGVNAFSYMGMHSQGRDFPRATVEDDVGASFMTRSIKGYSRVGGNAEHRIMDYATGGICNVEGTVQHKPGDGMTDTTWPTVLVAIGGLESAIHNVKDGMIVTLNTNHQLSGRKPAVYRFTDYNMHTTFLQGNTLAQAADIISEYIREWKPRAAA